MIRSNKNSNSYYNLGVNNNFLNFEEEFELFDDIILINEEQRRLENIKIQILKLRKKNTKSFECYLNYLSLRNSSLKTDAKELSFLMNLTRLRIVNFKELIEGGGSIVRGYLFDDKSFKITPIHIEMEDQLESTKLFWKIMKKIISSK